MQPDDALNLANCLLDATERALGLHSVRCLSAAHSSRRQYLSMPTQVAAARNAASFCCDDFVHSHAFRRFQNEKHSKTSLFASGSRFNAPSCRVSRQERILRRKLQATSGHPLFENRELVAGDCAVLLSYCVCKRISTIVARDGFEGWLAPIHLDAAGFVGFCCFSMTVVSVWIASSALVGSYKYSATETTEPAATRALQSAAIAWLTAIPLATAAVLISSSIQGDLAITGTKVKGEGRLHCGALPCIGAACSTSDVILFNGRNAFLMSLNNLSPA